MARLRHLSPVSVNLSHISTIPGKTPEESVLYYARVSNPESQNKSGGRLLQYLIDHDHWSPFEMVSMCIDISTTRDISRQILRHRSFSFQEFFSLSDLQSVIMFRDLAHTRSGAAFDLILQTWS